MFENLCTDKVHFVETIYQDFERFLCTFPKINVLYERRLFGVMLTIETSKPRKSSSSQLVYVMSELRCKHRQGRSKQCVSPRNIYLLTGVESDCLPRRFEDVNTRCKYWKRFVHFHLQVNLTENLLEQFEQWWWHIRTISKCDCGRSDSVRSGIISNPIKN